MEATVQMIFRLAFEAFNKTHKLSEHVRFAIECFIACRTRVLGGHRQSCPDGHFHRFQYNSYKHRMCPTCAWMQIRRWLERKKDIILNCDHIHVIFTIPHDLNFLWHLNTRLMTDILFHCSRDTILELSRDGKYMGALPGFISTLHTWTKKLMLHPHIHCLVSAGGLSAQEDWKLSRYDCLFPFAVAGALFRGKVCAAFRQALIKEKLQLPENMRPQQMINLLNKLGRKKWNVRVCEKISRHEYILEYLARYIRGGPIKNSRILKIENDQVTFDCGRGKNQEISISLEEFIRRFIGHIPEENAVLVRSYGLYSNAKRDRLDCCRAILGQTPVCETGPIYWPSCFDNQAEHPGKCPVCGRHLIITETYERQWSPRYPLRSPTVIYDGQW